jgi:uncharacterized protein (TIGR01244 family)
MLRKPRHWHEVSPRLLTAGQPTAEDFKALKVMGVEVVINLSMPDSDHALPDEDRIVAAQGQRYHHIPVVFEAPTADDFERFRNAMSASRDSTVFVHCAANKRVSAFVYLWRVLTQGVPQDVAERDLLAVWTPDAVWSAFIAVRLAAG